MLTALVVAGSSCGDETGSCTEVREPVDPRSGMHVITEGAFEYRTDPPTSGPHSGGPAPSGVFDEPLAAPVQVRILESGAALVQWEGVDDGTRADLETLARGQLDPSETEATVVVAPGRDLPEPIVATAWTWKLSCAELDLDALTEFVASRPLDAPGAD